MPHRFTNTSEHELEGLWQKYNGSRFCRWRYDVESRTLKASRGVVVRTVTLESETRSLEELKEELPTMALELAKRKPDAA